MTSINHCHIGTIILQKGRSDGIGVAASQRADVLQAQSSARRKKEWEGIFSNPWAW